MTPTRGTSLASDIANNEANRMRNLLFGLLVLAAFALTPATPTTGQAIVYLPTVQYRPYQAETVYVPRRRWWFGCCRPPILVPRVVYRPVQPANEK